jgi:hypothetical protein
MGCASSKDDTAELTGNFFGNDDAPTPAQERPKTHETVVPNSRSPAASPPPTRQSKNKPNSSSKANNNSKAKTNNNTNSSGRRSQPKTAPSGGGVKSGFVAPPSSESFVIPSSAGAAPSSGSGLLTSPHQRGSPPPPPPGGGGEITPSAHSNDNFTMSGPRDSLDVMEDHLQQIPPRPQSPPQTQQQRQQQQEENDSYRSNPRKLEDDDFSVAPSLDVEMRSITKHTFDDVYQRGRKVSYYIIIQLQNVEPKKAPIFVSQTNQYPIFSLLYSTLHYSIIINYNE